MVISMEVPNEKKKKKGDKDLLFRDYLWYQWLSNLKESQPAEGAAQHI